MNRVNAALLFVLCGAVLSCAGADHSTPLEVEAGGFVTAFQDGVAPAASYDGTLDTMLEEDHASTTHGTSKKLSVSGDTPGGSRKDDAVLLQWDVSDAIPANAIVRAATITITVTDKANQSYGLFEVLRDWDEDTATFKSASSFASWGLPGAAGVTDRAPAQLGAIRAASTGRFTISLNSAGVAAVQRWVADPSANHGIIIANASNDNRLELSSREDSKSSRPRLEVAWAPGGGTGGGPVLDPTPGTYRQTCDGSGAVALDFTHFLDLDDEDQGVRIYTRATDGGPAQQVDVSSALGLAVDDEADFEDAARVGNRIYAISSHGRDKDGVLSPNRFRFFAIDLAGTVPALQLTVAGSTDQLLVDLLDAANWDRPDAALLAALEDSAQLSQDADPDLSPEVNGFNIEGLASDPSPTNPERLLIGLRNPRVNGRAILVTLENPADVVAGATARFGEVIALDLGGLGVRSLAWSEAHKAILIIGGPPADVGAVRLFKWSGDPASTPTVVQDLISPAGTAAEAVVPYPGTKDVQILFDDGALEVNGKACKKLAASAQSFTDQIIHVE